MKRRVVVTGLGTISALGLTVPKYWASLLEGKSAVKKITRFDTEGMAAKIAAEITDFDPRNYLDRRQARRTDLHHRYILAAAQEAMADSGLKQGDYKPERAGTIVGTANGGAQTFAQQHVLILTKGPRYLSPNLMQMMYSDMAPSLISIAYGLKGPNFVNVATCASGTLAIGSSLRFIQYGDADVMVTGGTESPLTRHSLEGYCTYKAISQRNDEPERSSRPFDKDRDGFVLGEGAAVLVLEELEHAKRRGAKIYTEIAGYGMSADAYHITAPDPEGHGAAQAMTLAIKEAGIKPDEIDYVNAHGTSTLLGDPAETNAFKLTFGDYAYKVTINSTKSCVGHLLGGAGAIEAVATIMSMRDNKIHPTINLDNPDPECDLDYSANRITEKEITYALKNSSGFGGHNGALVFKKYQD